MATSPSALLIPCSPTLNHCRIKLSSFGQFFKHFKRPGPFLVFPLLSFHPHLQFHYLVLLLLL